jgi:hypothetical protein
MATRGRRAPLPPKPGCDERCAAMIAHAGVAEARGRALLQQAGPPRNRPEACVATCNVATCTLPRTPCIEACDAKSHAAHTRQRWNTLVHRAPTPMRRCATCTVHLARQAACNMQLASYLIRRAAHTCTVLATCHDCVRVQPPRHRLRRAPVHPPHTQPVRPAPSQKLRPAMRRRGELPQITPLSVPAVPHRTRVQARRALGR